jgi:mannosyltransferase
MISIHARHLQASRELSRIDPWILGAMLVAIAVRLARLDDAPLWFDETLTATTVRMSWAQMVQSTIVDNNLPLYFLLLKAWTVLAGTSPWALRLPSAVFSWATVPLCAGIAYTFKDKAAARWAAWFAALSPYLLQHGQEARVYALLGVLAALNILLLARFITGRSIRLGVACLLVNIALLATHYYGVFLIGAELLVLALVCAQRWRAWAPAMAASCLLSLLLAWPAWFVADGNVGGNYQMNPLWLPGMMWSLISGYTLLPTSAELHAQGARAALAHVPIAAAGLFAVAILGVAALRSTPKPALFTLITILLVVMLAPFAAGALARIAVNPRYAMAALPALLVLLAAGAPENPKQRLRSLAAGLLLLILSGASALHLAEPGHGREDIQAAGIWLDVNVPAADEILVSSEEMALLARFHWPTRRFTLYPEHKVVADSSNASRLAAAAPLSRSNRTIYLFGREWLSDPNGALRAALKARYRTCPGSEARGIQLLCFEPRNGS